MATQPADPTLFSSTALPPLLYSLWKISWLQPLLFHTPVKLTTSPLYSKAVNGPPWPILLQDLSLFQIMPLPLFTSCSHQQETKCCSRNPQCCFIVCVLAYAAISAHTPYLYSLSVQSKKSYLFFKIGFTFSMKSSLTQNSVWGWITIPFLSRAIILSYSISIALITQC